MLECTTALYVGCKWSRRKMQQHVLFQGGDAKLTEQP